MAYPGKKLLKIGLPWKCVAKKVQFCFFSFPSFSRGEGDLPRKKIGFQKRLTPERNAWKKGLTPKTCSFEAKDLPGIFHHLSLVSSLPGKTILFLWKSGLSRWKKCFEKGVYPQKRDPFKKGLYPWRKKNSFEKRSTPKKILWTMVLRKNVFVGEK